jgi:hypothetical protein
MTDTDNRTIPEIIIQLHDLARKQSTDASEIRSIADRISHLENLERTERYKHVHDFTPHKLPPSLYSTTECED